MPLSQEVEEWMEWRERERHKHRTMTSAEYYAWCFSGDVISHPSSSDAFPGGITIDFSGGREAAILGKTST